MNIAALLKSLLAKLGFIRIGPEQIDVTEAPTPAKLTIPEVVDAGIDAAIGAPATLQSGVVEVTETPWETKG